MSRRPLADSDDTASLPFTIPAHHLTGEVAVSSPIDPLLFKKGEWVDVPFWKGVRCLGVSLSEREVTVLCDVETPIYMGAHDHGEWAERLIMAEGLLYEHVDDTIYKPGKGVYTQQAGKVHCPEFLEPSVAYITWSR